MKKKISIIVLICIIILAIVSIFYSQNQKKSDTETTKTATTTASDTTTETKKAKEATEEIPATEEGTEESEATTAAKRDSSETKELFRLALAYIEENNLDSDDFEIKKALLVQDLEHDYIYFQCKYGDTTEYACYTYDGYYFRDESQSVLKKEYKNMLLSVDYDNDEYNIYYSFSNEEINSVNKMF